ncbi:MAG: hypothetical protein C4560_13185 [Nitrospiraceae bacterium]|nr:MAG: hypothetical protein C4560_13185 [Nitrospiraceae bacterium]
MISALDHMMKETTCAGNMSQVVLVFDSIIEPSGLRERLGRFLDGLPVVRGSVARDINICPYWRMPEKVEGALNFTYYNCSSESDLLPLLSECVNRPFKNDSEHLAFYLINIENRKNCLAMAFDHILFDARGAKTFLSLFQQYLESGDAAAISKGVPLTAPAHLSEWKNKFLAGRNVNRRIVALSKTPPATLPVPCDKNRGFKFRLISFNQQETQTILDNAYREAGYLMETPYLLAAVMQAMHELFMKRGLTADSFLASVNIDMRTDEDIKRELFFNHVSYLFYQVPSDIMDNPKEIMASIKMQMYEQVKAGIPRDITEASHLTRIAPLSFLKKIIDLPLKGKIATFIFSHVSKNPLLPHMMGAKIENVFHMPRVPVPPGLGFFSNYFDGRLNLVISYLDGMLGDEEANLLEKCIREMMMEIPSPPAGEG